MKLNVIYFHRIHFPSASGQTIQVLRDYFALSGQKRCVHLLYRLDKAHSLTKIDQFLKNYAARLTDTFHLHCIPDGKFGKRRTKKKVLSLADSSQSPVLIVTRTMDHARAALGIRQKLSCASHPIKVILELHETAIPHMVYAQQNRNIKARISLMEEKQIFRKLDGILCTVPVQLKILDKKFPGHSPAVVLPNNFEASLFQNLLPKKAVQVKEKFHIRYAGQFSSWKNTDIMFKTLALLPGSFVLDIAGGRMGNETQTRTMLNHIGKQYGVSRRIHYAGFLSPKQIPLFLHEANCLLLPLGNNVQSRFFTSPMKLFEYAASHTPMVVTRQPTTESLIQDKVHALMVEPDSPEQMAAAIRYIAENPETATQIAGQANKWAARHTSTRRAEKYLKFIKTLQE